MSSIQGFPRMYWDPSVDNPPVGITSRFVQARWRCQRAFLFGAQISVEDNHGYVAGKSAHLTWVRPQTNAYRCTAFADASSRMPKSLARGHGRVIALPQLRSVSGWPA